MIFACLFARESTLKIEESLFQNYNPYIRRTKFRVELKQPGASSLGTVDIRVECKIHGGLNSVKTS